MIQIFTTSQRYKAQNTQIHQRVWFPNWQNAKKLKYPFHPELAGKLCTSYSQILRTPPWHALVMVDNCRPSFQSHSLARWQLTSGPKRAPISRWYALAGHGKDIHHVQVQSVCRDTQSRCSAYYKFLSMWNNDSRNDAMLIITLDFSRI